MASSTITVQYLLSFVLHSAATWGGWSHGPQIQGNCTANDRALDWLSHVLSPQAVISCRGQPLQVYNAQRYWGKQYGKNASVVVFPANAQDVSLTMRATQWTSFGEDYAFVCGAHSTTNSSSSYGFVIDLSYLNGTQIINNFPSASGSITAIAYGGGTTTLQMQTALNGTGYTAVGARVGSVGLGGFSTGGGIGFIAGAYGFATDRLVALEAVLPSGQIVYATEHNKHSDLFWAFKGAGLGQFGIITTFYQKAAPEPKVAKLSFHVVSNTTANIQRSFQNTVEFFNTHEDPFSLMYYAFGFYPLDLTNPNPKPSDFALVNILSTVYFDDPTASGTSQSSYNETFAALLSNISFISEAEYTLPYANLSVLSEGFFPYGSRHGFWGPQTTNISATYMTAAQTEFANYVNAVLANGDFPATSTWVLQYMSPGLNGNLPASDSATAWPHSVVGHQTLFDPGWSLSSSDDIANIANEAFNRITYTQQAQVAGYSTAGSEVCGGVNLCDYPNYIGADVSGKHVWGGNIPRLISIKNKYDPDCTLHTGRVFASKACIAKGVANVYP